MTRPIKKLAKGAASIGEGNLDTKIDVSSKNELGNLASEFNNMALKLKELDQMKNDFVSSVSHELRSPLTAIEGYVDFFLQGISMQDQGVTITKEKQVKALNIMKNNTRRLSGFINDILDLAKIEAAQMEMVKEPTLLKGIIEEMVTLFIHLAEEKKITLSYNVEGEVGEISVDGDKMKQVLSNLISNALKFTPEGGKIIIGLKDQVDSQLISVKDTGIGIPKDSLNAVFDKFRQVEGVREKIKGAKGTGLGLAIVKGIVEGHGGKIWVESELGKGSTFLVRLPKK
jgi:two-component system sensor histidine kinase GlrK